MVSMVPSEDGFLGVERRRKRTDSRGCGSCPPKRVWFRRVGLRYRCPSCGLGWRLNWHGAMDSGVKLWDLAPELDSSTRMMRDGRIKPPKGPGGVSRPRKSG